MTARLEPVTFSRLKGWRDDNHVDAVAAFIKTFQTGKRQKTRKLGISPTVLADLAQKAEDLSPFDRQSARQFFESNFQPHEVIPDGCQPGDFAGLVTAYFEPEVPASRTMTSEFQSPLYARPGDLVDVDHSNRPDGFSSEMRFGRLNNGVIGEYPDRATIEAGYLRGRGLEIAWVRDKVEALFIHIQGSARLRFSNGSTIRVGYAAKSGHPYTAVGSVLLKRGGLGRDNCGMQAIRNWLSRNPDQVDDVLNHNRSFVFFMEYPDSGETGGPVGAARVDLTPMRSIAVDRTLHTFGVPIWIETNKPLPGSRKNFNSMMVAQDTGSAIVGPVRGDLFLGSGESAGKIAGEVRHQARFIVFVPGVAR